MICITAAAAVTLACLIHDVSLFDMALWVSVAIMLFFVLGQVARHYLMTHIFPPPAPENEVPEEEAISETAGGSTIPSLGSDNPLGYMMTAEPVPAPETATDPMINTKPDFAPIMEE